MDVFSERLKRLPIRIDSILCVQIAYRAEYAALSTASDEILREERQFFVKYYG
jgi:hypothetical protein